MSYDHRATEAKWQQYWAEQKTYQAQNGSEQPKFYVLDMFPYPSGAGLHVGHPLGYIASDIYARYKRHKGFNVLHPMGYDSFGLPAEQYAIQTGQHPAITTEENIARYRGQLDRIGFSFDWDREVRTSDPAYYRWTQWIFKQLFNSWYDNSADRARPLNELIAHFEEHGTEGLDAAYGEMQEFTASAWRSMTAAEQQNVLSEYRLTFLSETWVNWCEALGTVLANDEIKDGVSERGGHPVTQKRMWQWSMRITAYAQRLLDGLDTVDFSEALKEQQRNWIGRSQGAQVFFDLDGHEEQIEVFTTRPDTIFGVSFMVLAPEHELVAQITTDEQRNEVEAYIEATSRKSERDRQADVKNITGVFTGAHVLHPFTGERVPVWIGDYVLAGYGTGAVMAVPCGDQRDYEFARHFGIDIPNIFEDQDISEAAYGEKEGRIAQSDFLNGLEIPAAIVKAVEEIEKAGRGKGKVNFRLRDAIFSRQRYWGEPFPIYYQDDLPFALKDEELPLTLPPVDEYLPTSDGEPPLARAAKEDWPQFHGDRMETNTMPGWAGSSWYFLRYMDPHNEGEFVSREVADYWGQVDLYVGGSEHATGHLLYSRFWTKFLYDFGYIGFDEPFKKLVNQGMILGTSALVYRINGTNTFVSKGLASEHETTALHVDVNMVENDVLNLDRFKAWRNEFADAEFILEDGQYLCGSEVEKMSKRWYNVVNPDDICDRYGADVLRMYEMFLGPIDQAKPWNTNGISGVSNFIKKLWRLYVGPEGQNLVVEDKADKKELKALHTAIKKINEDIVNLSYNTSISNFMICVNELNDLKCHKREVLESLAILVSPFAPHIAEELWARLGHAPSVTTQAYPVHDESVLVEDSHEYPVMFNGKMRFKQEFSLALPLAEVEAAIRADERTEKYAGGNPIKKVIVVPKKIINVVC
ncbi:leucine--tRNA ligase [Cryomorphaceae bacterium]|nr:leucine--tRNA ligase [Cryomorphaceae bacterium]